MTDKKTEALKLALEALRDYRRSDDDRVSVAMGILQEALAEQPAQQEPIGKWMGNAVEWTENPYKFRKGQLIYTSPPAQQQEPLTQDMVESCPYHGETLRGAFFDGWIKAEAAHGIKEKNGA